MDLSLNESERLVAAARKWRIKLNSETGIKKGAFSGFRIILHCDKKEAFVRIITAGDGKCISAKPPYRNSQAALNATHCLVDTKYDKMDEKDYRALQQAGVHVFKIEFLHQFLTNVGEVNMSKVQL